MKTILILTWYYLPFIGGAELFVRAITERLSGRFRFIVIAARVKRDLPTREQFAGATVLRVGTGHVSDKFLYPIPSLLTALRSEPVDLVHSIMVNASTLTAYAYLKFKNKPSLLTLQEGDSEDYVKDWLGPFFPIYPKLHRPFDRIHAISSFLRDQAVTYGADPHSISVVPNGVDTEVFNRSAHSPQEIAALRRRLGLKGKRVIISVSRLVNKNGLDSLIRALPIVLAGTPNAVLLLVGDGKERKKLESLAGELGIREAVRFTGSVEHRETSRYILLSEVFVRPSVSEGLGSAFLEAMASEVPLVGTPVGGIVDFLEDGETGLFCRPNHPESIADAVLRLMRDHALAQRLSSAGRRLVERDYTWERVTARIGRIYDELLAG